MKPKNEHISAHFTGAFAALADEYISLNRAIGNKYNLDTVYLMQFDKYCVDEKAAAPILTKELFDGWCAKRSYESDRSHHIRIRTLRRFADFLRKNGIEAPTAFHPLPRLLPSFTPYIFTRAEISRFLIAASSAKSNSHSPLAGLVLPLLFKTLYCCGLRLSEVLTLKNPSVDLVCGTFLILDAKGGKDRLVPMSESLRLLCVEYRENPLIQRFNSEYFFSAPDGGLYSKSWIYVRFRNFLQQAGISHGGRGKGPRLHDIRYTYAVHTLDNWAREERDMLVVLPILSAYLGHKNIFATQRYLRLTPEAYPVLLGAFDKHFGSVFPEVRYE